MKVRSFFVEKDLPHVDAWLRARNLPPVDPKSLPKVGFLVEKCELLVACAFLRQMEGGIGLYESQATNPQAPAALRHEALNFLFVEICKAARSLGFRQLIAHTTDKSTLERSARYGFKQLPEILIALDLPPLSGE